MSAWLCPHSFPGSIQEGKLGLVGVGLKAAGERMWHVRIRETEPVPSGPFVGWRGGEPAGSPWSSVAFAQPPDLSGKRNPL